MKLINFSRRLVLAASAVTVIETTADTGPEYLQTATSQDPLSQGFKVLRLPYSEERHTRLNLRTFYMDRDLDSQLDARDWAAGGSLTMVTDFWQDRIKLGATGYTSQKIWSDDNTLSTGLLQPDGDSYSALGEIYANVTLDKLAVQAGRFLVNMPYINASDSRMTPNTFQGVDIVYAAQRAVDRWRWRSHRYQTPHQHRLRFTVRGRGHRGERGCQNSRNPLPA